jgi:Uma2 family endonuclease
MSVLAQPAGAPGTTPAPEGNGEQRLLLYAVSWETYVAVGEAFQDRAGLRMTYDRGRLEFMTTSPRHEIYKKLLGRLLENLAEECNLPTVSAGNATFRNPEYERGLEPDECYWIAHEKEMRGKQSWDPKTDPPPDLVLEIEISRGALDRMAIYAAMGIPEVWRFDGERIRVHLLQPDKTWLFAERSPTFPAIPLGEMAKFAQPSETVDALSMIQSFRSWVREQAALNDILNR